MQTLSRKALEETIIEKVKNRLISFGYGKATESTTEGEIVEGEEEIPDGDENTSESTTETQESTYQFNAMEEMILSFTADKCIRTIEMKLNSEIPLAFEYALVDMIVGEFLQGQLNLGTLKMNAIDYNMVVKSVQEGDTTITFGEGMTDGDKLTTLISFLMHPEINYADYRKIRW